MAHMKPNNINVGRQAKVLLIGFGVATATYFALRMLCALLTAINGSEMWDGKTLAIAVLYLVCCLWVDGIMDESPESSGDSEPPAP